MRRSRRNRGRKCLVYRGNQANRQVYQGLEEVISAIVTAKKVAQRMRSNGKIKRGWRGLRDKKQLQPQASEPRTETEVQKVSIRFLEFL
jgi:hypothetical protein